MTRFEIQRYQKFDTLYMPSEFNSIQSKIEPIGFVHVPIISLCCLRSSCTFLGVSLRPSVHSLQRDGQDIQLSSTVSRTRLLYSFRFSTNNRAASALAGLLGLGSCSRLWILVKIAATSYVGDHRFCKMSKQRSPFAYTLGWNIRVTNLTCGGFVG